MAASMSEEEMIPRVPVVVILGATGSGKSKLAIEIGKIFNGEIVSADSMQLYKGLDVITNKVTAEERRMVPHHMLDFLDPHVNLNVVDYRNMALRKVEELIGKGKLPLVVGGTNYYIESLLWRVLVAGEVNKGLTSLFTQRDGRDDEKIVATPPSRSPTSPAEADVDDESVPNSELYKRLSEVDPEMAKSLHPNNRRKIFRSLQVYEQLGKPHSVILKEQRELEGGGPLGGPLRFPNSCILWLRCDPDVLDKRLDDRVDDMLKAGLVDELLDFHRRYNASRLKAGSQTAPDYTKGIFQSIGFKEFHEYLMWVGKREGEGGNEGGGGEKGEGGEEGAKGEEEREEGGEEEGKKGEVAGVKGEAEGKEEGAKEDGREEGAKEDGKKRKRGGEVDEEKRLFQEGVENLKLATRRYSRKQVRWITNRFLRQPDRQVPRVYGLDTTDPSRWDELVLGPATEIVKSLLADKKPSGIEPLPVVPKEGASVEWNGEPKRCEVCDRLFVDPLQWSEHLSSKKHKRVLERQKREKSGEGGGDSKKMKTGD